eukprot:gnl/TRDRNA2_/TRDRNA2_177480_c1_seq4.p1 gnl/TRDRNA2_/TRDRNA2_177480_c1~~gnl/TRDRNA2_/TRDRNA2_177480_c1_seq4.p1  ORF type:complete len:1607 (-),score=271.05 gnl/TRDRNA2_/TRDRNA2_177480_c1_seq4:140-4501(-)
MPQPQALPFKSNPASWPTDGQWTGHAIAIVGGWQLVVVKAAADGGVWRFLNSTYVVQKVAEAPLPFEDRMDPKLMSTSDNKLYLLGGHKCEDMLCKNNMVMSDLWRSDDVGATWMCQTMGIYANTALSSMITQYSKGIGRYYSAVMTGDDTIWILAGHQPNTTQGLNRVFSAYTNPPDDTFSSTTYLASPTTTVLKSMESVAIFFKENIQMGTGTIQFADGADILPVKTRIAAQGIYLSPTKPLIAGKTYTLQMPAGSVKNAGGHPLGLLNPGYSFSVNSDTTAPKVTATYPEDSAASVSPATTIKLTLSEPVLPGSGSLALIPLVGTPFMSDISTATIRSREITSGHFVYDVFFPPVSLTLGATYTIQVPAGLLKDVAGNAITAADVATFTVLSGIPPKKNPYAGNDFIAGNPDCSKSTACNATLDTRAPTFVSMFPKNGATDVPAISGNAIVMYFSEPVKFNTSGIITIKNSTNNIVGVVNLTRDALEISPAANATKIPIPAVLVKGQSFSVSIPSGLIKDLAGNSLSAVSKSFTCLAEMADTSAPIATGMSINATTNMIDVFFSEDIMMGQEGNVSAVGTVYSGSALSTPVNHSNTTVSGFKLSLSVFAGFLSTANVYDLQISAGSLRDAAGNVFRGLNGSTMQFTTSAADVTVPTLVSQVPPHEPSPTFTLPVSTPLVLTFSEAVQAVPGTTAVTLTPIFGNKQIHISTSDVFIDEATAVLTGSILMPGEWYKVTVHSGAFMDMAGNAFAGLASGYTISTRASMGFVQVSSGNWGGTDYFDGSRYGSCGLVDSSNALYLVGGINGTAGASISSMMNDVWRYDSKRESACASSLVPYTCSEKTCLDATTLATTIVARTVWRAPTANGAPCTSPTGKDFRDLWATVEMSNESCSCPMCLAPPQGALPSHMANQSYLSAYTLLSAASSTLPLECAPGKIPNGSFTCVVDTQYVGKFETPYPNCYASPCFSPPVTTGISSFSSFTTMGTDGEMDCSSLNDTYSMPSGGTCAVTCEAGFIMAKGFECFEGQFSDAVCIPLTPCSQASASVRNGAIECEGGTTAEYGQACPIVCNTDDGYSPYMSGAVATCEVSDDGSMSFAAPAGMTLGEVCVATTCAPPEPPANAIYFSKAGTSVDATWSLTCADGYAVDVSGAVTTSCQKNGQLTEPLPVCIEAAGCDGSIFSVETVTDADDIGNCMADMKDGDKCQLQCAEGFEAVGDFVCNNGRLDGILNCLDADRAAQAEEVQLMSSAFALAVDLAGMSQDEILSLFTAVIARVLTVGEEDIAKVDIGASGRQLAAQRRLQARYEVAYQAIISPGTDPAALAARATSIGAGGASQDLFIAAFAEAGVTVDASSLRVTQAPRTFKATVVRGDDGKPVAPSPAIPTAPPTQPSPQPTEAPSPGEPTPVSKPTGKARNVGAIVGGAVGGVMALLILAGVAYYAWIVKRKTSE